MPALETEARPPAAGERWALVPSRAAAEFGRMPRAVRRLMRVFDGVRTLEAICAESALPEPRTRRVIERLAQLGVIAPVVDDTPLRRLSARALAWINGDSVLPPVNHFSDEEEQFFSSSVEHLLEELRAP